MCMYSRRQKKVPRSIRLILISPFPFSGTGEYTHACMSRVLFLSRVLLLEAQQEQTSKYVYS